VDVIISVKKMAEAECSECGAVLDVPEGWHYCPDCDIETYFYGDN